MTEDERHARIIELANEQYLTDDIEIDDESIVSENDDPEMNGCYVSAWVWVEFDGTEFDKELTGSAAEADLAG